MTDTVAFCVALDAEARNVGRARRLLRDAMERSGADRLTDSATLLMSETVTNAFVHVGSLSWSGLG